MGVVCRRREVKKLFLLILLFFVENKSESNTADLFAKQTDDSDDSVESSPDGGFASLDSMLHWAIGHSDPDKLKQTSQAVLHGLPPSDLQNRQLELQQLLQDLNTPSDSQLMQLAIQDLNNSSLSLQHHLRALHHLLILVEPIHNALLFDKLGGFTTILRALDSCHPDIRISSAWLLGKSCQNNPTLQHHVLTHGALPKLIAMTQSHLPEEAGKALYAVSALLRNNFQGQDLFYALSGPKMLQDIMSNSSIDMALRRKAIVLVADLVESHLEAKKDTKELAYFSNRAFLKSLVDLTASTDIDIQEKALVAIKNLLQVEKIEGVITEEDCGLDEALERMRQKLEDVMEDEERRDYAMDVESLRREVELMIVRKVGTSK